MFNARLVVLGLCSLAACGTSPAATGPDAGGLPSDAVATDAPASAKHQLVPVVPQELGMVSRFAYNATAIFPIVQIANKPTLVRCPQPACTASPTVIATTQQDSEVEVLGDHVYWIGDTGDVMQANLDGSTVKSLYHPLGFALTSQLRQSGGKLYVLGKRADTKRDEIRTVDPTTGSAVYVAAKVSPIDPPTAKFDVLGARVAVWYSAGTAPAQIYVTDLSSTSNNTRLEGAGTLVLDIRLSANGVFYNTPDTGSNGMHACNTSPCVTPPTLAVFSAIGAFGDRVYFGTTTAVASCSLTDLAAGACTPQVEAPMPEPQGTDNVITQVRADASAIYIANFTFMNSATVGPTLFRVDR